MNECIFLGLNIIDIKEYEKDISRLHQLTPGDIAAVRRQHKFKPIKSPNDFINRLENEIYAKEIDTDNVMGFAI